MPPPPPASLRLQGFQGYASEFSPFFDNKLAVASAANYGIVGNGRLWIIDLSKQGYLVPEKSFDTQDGLFDLAWSESHEAQLVTGSGDGSIKLWDIGLNEFPVANWAEHQREVFSVNWNQVDKSQFASASWDRTIKLWAPGHATSLLTLAGHHECVYSAVFAPDAATILASGSGDRTLRVWDTRSAAAGPASTVIAHNHDVLSVDWDKYRPTVVYTGSADHDVKAWDTRRLDVPLATLGGHEFPVRRVRACPHRAGRVVSVGYDMSVRVWDVDVMAPGHPVPARPVWRSDAHTEFVLGADWSLFHPGQLVTAGWDSAVCLHQIPM
ncbi:peroxisomal targeting signal 2 receptor [Blastocladiella emersonii ATCC 22665]|nr:peroxisomal targeting signal 2 receptor [Blastocladiella emersonii ATCC 22665]